MPGDHRFGLYDQQRRAPLRPEAGEPNPEQSVRQFQTKPAAPRPLEDGDLVAESQDLDLQGSVSLKPGTHTNNRGEKGSEHGRNVSNRLRLGQ